MRQKKGFWIPPLAAELERAKIFAPRSLGNFWLRFHPKAQLIQVGESDVAVVHALDKMVSNGGGQRGPSLDLRHHSPGVTHLVLLAKDETTQLVAQLLDLFRIIGGAEAFGQLKERLLLLLSRFDSLLDQFDQDSVIAEIALLRQGLNLPGDLGRQSHASPHVLKSS